MNKLDQSKSTSQEARIFRDQLITVGDLEHFKQSLLVELKKIVKEFYGQPGKKWLKSYEVKKLLGISPGTLQNLRVNGTLPFTKIGGVILYDYEDVQKMITDHKREG